ncbi:MAG: MBOAT family protein [Clostridia bacterium]|nr:MBOAT family protein [Clostridia bacterium]
MQFSSLFFLFFFLPICLICYFAAKKIQTKNVVLIAFSLVFYAWGCPWWTMIPLLGSTVFNWAIAKAAVKNRGAVAGKIAIGVGVAVNVALLMSFKYVGVFIPGTTDPSAFLPVGMSFYTFQSISYLLDCYWEKSKPQEDFSKFLLYITVFPQMSAGPIVRYGSVEKALSDRRTTAVDLYEGALRAMVGLAKKVIIADSLLPIVDSFFGKDVAGMSVLGTWYVVIVYSLYVYFDFSGYTDVALGLGRVFGFRFDENFRHPFACKTISEFWQRWHISLGSFFRDYLLYLPIGGKVHKYLNLFLVWFCTGMWHGATFNYILWGLYFGAFILLEQQIGKKRLKKWPVVLTHLYSKAVIIIGFGIFYFKDFGQLGQFFLNITGLSLITNGAPIADPVTWSSLTGNLFLVAAAILCSLPILPALKERVQNSNNTLVYTGGRVIASAACVAMLVICCILLASANSAPNLYFAF